MRSRSPALVRTVLLALALACAAALLAVAAPAASAHVVPTSTLQLDVRDGVIDAALAIPVTDVEAAVGVDLGEGSQADIDAEASSIRTYLQDRITLISDDGTPWTMTVGALTVSEAGDQQTTGIYRQLETTLTLTPPASTDERSFDVAFTAIVDKVATHVVIVTVRSDWTAPDLTSAYQLGTIHRDTVTGDVQALHVGLTGGSGTAGFSSMVSLGMHHIAEGTDHQLFLLTLLLPAPLLATGRRWAGAVGPRAAVRRFAGITLAFTLGHSATLALGALGVPVPQQLVEALIALSILVAAVHAIRPVFPGREALVAAGFGLVHGLAFSEALRELDLNGGRLATALLGFNLGIEAMQLIVVALVLPPLILLAHANRYCQLRVVAALATGVAALGWLGARLGVDNPVATAADELGVIVLPVVAALWLAAIAITVKQHLDDLHRRDAEVLTDSPVTSIVQESPMTAGGPPRPHLSR
ncbi:HupE/UreJ family protein [Friedmanniella luteola]|uniref:HupE/UreJ family protein n=1 Tax=Friedmanniella luteola TaxID=546871 RepID=UPI0012FE56CA|nr:HupE/UreJ family protein [Friedmanniella luteola]